MTTEKAPVTPRTEAGKALLEAHGDAAVYCGMGDENLAPLILAIEAEAASPAGGGLDVERLARAIWIAAFQRPGEQWDERQATDGDEWYGTPMDMARALAAEYARLAATTPDREV